MTMGHGSWVMWVMGQLCDGSWVTKDDPFPSLGGIFNDQFIADLPLNEAVKKFLIFNN